jgi:hypothetical protein
MSQEESLTVDQILEQEKTFNKTEPWNKLNKTSKIQMLHVFSERYGHKNKLSVKEIKLLKQFFSSALDKKQLQKTKEVIYNKELQEVSDVPGLLFNSTNNTFYIKMDNKRQSTLKSLTPKRNTEKTKTSSSLSSSLSNNSNSDNTNVENDIKIMEDNI